ncbi:hypothetical protein BSM4216_2480 [Bacillus smithii]|nr:hypothetical protein BSM4216_2480 [Bacillus smithii]
MKKEEFLKIISNIRMKKYLNVVAPFAIDFLCRHTLKIREN